MTSLAKRVQIFVGGHSYTRGRLRSRFYSLFTPIGKNAVLFSESGVGESE